MDIFAGIDGTLSHNDVVWDHLFGPWMSNPGGNAENSHVYRFYQRLVTKGDAKSYFEGPGITGNNVPDIAHNVTEFISRALLRYPNGRVSIVGHSRGGFIAILVAKALAGISKVHFLGLYDAVDRCATADVEIENAANVFHAVRSPWRLSRHYFGNTGRSDRTKVAFNYVEEMFYAAHGAIGGDLPKNSTFNDMMDKINGPRAHEWMRQNARNCGLRLL
jgi:pimeloyl-ACP methyl ester carboxylesterase